MIAILRKSPFQGFHLQFANGWTISVQTGLNNYHDARDTDAVLSSLEPSLLSSSPNAEIAVWHRDSPMVQWADGDTVQGWVSPDRIARVIHYISNLRDHPSAWGEGSTRVWLGVNGKEETLP
jgi:hypothetical protein